MRGSSSAKFLSLLTSKCTIITPITPPIKNGELNRVPLELHENRRVRYTHASEKVCDLKNAMLTTTKPSVKTCAQTVHNNRAAGRVFNPRRGFHVVQTLCVANPTPWTPPQITKFQLGPCHNPHNNIVAVMFRAMRKLGRGLSRVASSSGKNT